MGQGRSSETLKLAARVRPENKIFHRQFTSIWPTGEDRSHKERRDGLASAIWDCHRRGNCRLWGDLAFEPSRIPCATSSARAIVRRRARRRLAGIAHEFVVHAPAGLGFAWSRSSRKTRASCRASRLSARSSTNPLPLKVPVKVTTVRMDGAIEKLVVLTVEDLQTRTRQSENLVIKATVIPPFTIAPTILDFGNVAAGDRVSRQVRIHLSTSAARSAGDVAPLRQSGVYRSLVALRSRRTAMVRSK